MEKLKCRVGRPKGRGKRGKHGSPEGEWEEGETRVA